jgi:glycoside/pentoside/hexuronide:cation symporter, GPH family
MSGVNTTTGAGPLSLSLKASWGLGGLGATSMLYLINMFVVYFLVRYAAIPAATAGTLFALTRFYDAVVDPLIGGLSDRSTTRWGRRRPWMLAGALLSPLACIAVFHPPQLEPGATLYAAVLAALLLYCTAYSLFSIPYAAQGMELTDDYRERAAVMAWRTFWVYASGIAITAGAPALIAATGGDRRAYEIMSYAAALLVGASMLWVVAFTGRARALPRSVQPLNPLEALRAAIANRPFLTILLTKMTLQVGTAFSGASLLFFMTEVLGRAERGMAVLGLAANLAGVLAVPLWSRALRSIERRPLYITLLIGQGLAQLSWLLATPDEPVAVFVIRAALIGAFGSGSVLAIMAMLADTVELDRLQTGQRREGLFVGAFELMQTTSFVIGPFLVGIAFQSAGLIAGEAGHGAQPESALQMMRAAVAIVPALCGVIGIALMSGYRLDAAALDSLRSTAASAQDSPPTPDSMNAAASRAVRAGSSSTS